MKAAQSPGINVHLTQIRFSPTYIIPSHCFLCPVYLFHDWDRIIRFRGTGVGVAFLIMTTYVVHYFLNFLSVMMNNVVILIVFRNRELAQIRRNFHWQMSITSWSNSYDVDHNKYDVIWYAGGGVWRRCLLRQVLKYFQETFQFCKTAATADLILLRMAKYDRLDDYQCYMSQL